MSNGLILFKKNYSTSERKILILESTGKKKTLGVLRRKWLRQRDFHSVMELYQVHLQHQRVLRQFILDATKSAVILLP